MEEGTSCDASVLHWWELDGSSWGGTRVHRLASFRLWLKGFKVFKSIQDTLQCPERPNLHWDPPVCCVPSAKCFLLCQSRHILVNG